MHYGQTTDESVCCQIFPGMLPEENDANFDVTNISFWVSKNPWQIIFDGYRKGITPGKQVNYRIGIMRVSYFENDVAHCVASAAYLHMNIENAWQTLQTNSTTVVKTHLNTK